MATAGENDKERRKPTRPKNRGFETGYDPDNPPAAVRLQREFDARLTEKQRLEHYRKLLNQARGVPDAALGRGGGLFAEAFGPSPGSPFPGAQRTARELQDVIRQSRLPGVGFPNFTPETPYGFVSSQLSQIDPRVAGTMLDEIGRIGEEANFPVTARGLRSIEPTQDPTAYAHHRSMGNRQWNLGIKGIDEEALQRLIRRDQLEGWTAGGSRAVDPIRNLAGHEMGHAIESGVDQFFNEPAMLRGQRAAREHWMGLRQQIAADTLNARLSKYPGVHAVKKVLNPVLAEGLQFKQRGLSMPHYLRNYFDVGDMVRGAEVTPEAIARLDPVMQGRLAREGIAESLGPLLSRPGHRQVLTPETARAMARGEQLMGTIDELRGLGYRGAATPGTMLKGAAAFGLPLLAPIIADRLPQQAQPVAQGAITGAGIGGLAGPQGALIGAGIGGVGGLLKQVFGNG